MPLPLFLLEFLPRLSWMTDYDLEVEGKQTHSSQAVFGRGFYHIDRDTN